jgi:hypothetical protein
MEEPRGVGARALILSSIAGAAKRRGLRLKSKPSERKHDARVGAAECVWQSPLQGIRMQFHLRPARAPRAALFAMLLAAGAMALAASSGETAFLAENHAAMVKMMKAMQVTPSGDVDSDFVAMMVPHHQGAVDMAQSELRYGRNEQLRRLAQEIIVTQQQEISVMRMALGQPLPPAAPAPTGAQSAPGRPMHSDGEH